MANLEELRTEGRAAIERGLRIGYYCLEAAEEIESLRSAVYKIQCPENVGKYPHYLDEREKAAIRRAVVSGLS